MTFRGARLVLVLLTTVLSSSYGQSVNDPIDDQIDCISGKAVSGLLPATVDIISIDIRKQNDDLIATVEFRGDPSIGDSVSGGIVALDPSGFEPATDPEWHFNNAGNTAFLYAGDALSTTGTKQIVDSLGLWVPDSTTGFTATRAGNVVVIHIPGTELGPGSLWMAFASSRMFEVVPRCDAAGNDNDGSPTLEVPQLVATVDAYGAPGNVGITVPSESGLLINDIDAASIIEADDVSLQGGSVVVDPTGGFHFEPAPGFHGEDSFSYTVTDGKGGSSVADVTIDVGPSLWFVDAAAVGQPGTGTAADPFPDIATLNLAAGTPSGPGPSDAILIFGDVTYRGSIALDSNQVLVGQGVDMLQTIQANGFQIAPFSDILLNPPAAGLPPVIASDSLNAIELSQNNRIFGLAVGDTPLGTAIHGDSVATLLVANVSTSGLGGIFDVSHGQIVISLESATSDSAIADAVSFQNVEGTLAVDDPVAITAPGRHGIRVEASSIGINLNGLSVSAADSGVAVSVTTSPTSQLDFGTVSVISTSGGGFRFDGAADLLVDAGIVRTGNTALDLREVNVGIALDTVSSSGLHGIHLAATTGTLAIGGATMISDTGSNGLDVEDSSLLLSFGDLNLGKADSSYGIHIVDSPESTLRISHLTIENTVGGGMMANNLDSLCVDAGFVNTVGGRSIDLSNLIADIRLEAASADSVDAGIVLLNLGGSFEIAGNDDPGSGGSISRVAGRAVDVRNASFIQLSDLRVSEVAGDAIRLENFGTISLSNLDIGMIDSAAVRAAAGGVLEVVGTSIMDARTGIEAYEVGQVILSDNEIRDTRSTAIIVSNVAPEAGTSKGVDVADGDIYARINRNEVLTGALDGILVSAARSGTLRLELVENQAISAANDYVLAANDTAMLRLDGFAGGDLGDVITFIQRTNLGTPRVRIVGIVGAGLTGQADLEAIEKTVSNLQPLPEREIEYGIRVTNRGPAPAFAVTLNDSLPEGLAYVPQTLKINGVPVTDAVDGDAADFGTTKMQTITADLGDLSIADTVTVTFSARATQAHAGLSIRNIVTVASTSPDSVMLNNEAEVEIVVIVNTGIETGEIPGSFALRQNYPNPFNPTTTIEFDLPTREFARLTILNVLGQPVAELLAQDLDGGRYEVRWDATTMDGSGAASGMYFYRLEAGSFVAIHPMILLK